MYACPFQGYKPSWMPKEINWPWKFAAIGVASAAAGVVSAMKGLSLNPHPKFYTPTPNQEMTAQFKRPTYLVLDPSFMISVFYDTGT